MIPPVFLVLPALSWVFALRCAAAYWQAMAETLGPEESRPADVVALPAGPAARRRMPSDHEAELFYLTPRTR